MYIFYFVVTIHPIGNQTKSKTGNYIFNFNISYIQTWKISVHL